MVEQILIFRKMQFHTSWEARILQVTLLAVSQASFRYFVFKECTETILVMKLTVNLCYSANLNDYFD